MIQTILSPEGTRGDFQGQPQSCRPAAWHQGAGVWVFKKEEALPRCHIMKPAHTHTPFAAIDVLKTEALRGFVHWAHNMCQGLC